MTREDARIGFSLWMMNRAFAACMTWEAPSGTSVRRRRGAEAALARSPAVTPTSSLRISGAQSIRRRSCFRQIKSRLPATEVVIMTGHGPSSRPSKR